MHHARSIVLATLTLCACDPSRWPADAAQVDAAQVDAQLARPDAGGAPVDDGGLRDDATVDADPRASAIRWRAALQAAADTLCACPSTRYADEAECLSDNSWEGEPGDCLEREYGVAEHLEYVLCALPHTEALGECVRAATCDEDAMSMCVRGFSDAVAECPSSGGPSCMP